MNLCERLSDRMPEVALGRSAWTAEETAHLSGCPACDQEWRLVLAAGRMGERLVPAEPEGVAASLQRRLATERDLRIRSRRVWSVVAGAAAAAAVLAAVIVGDRPSAEPQAVAAESGALVPLPELEALDGAELDTLLRTLDRPVAGSSTLDASTMGEYEDGELEQVFASWEG
jgi:hypothetical protein